MFLMKGSKNELAITDIMEVHAFYILVNTFGDIHIQRRLTQLFCFLHTMTQNYLRSAHQAR